MMVRCQSSARAVDSAISTSNTLSLSAATSSANACFVSSLARSQAGPFTNASCGGSGGSAQAVSNSGGRARGRVSGSSSSQPTSCSPSRARSSTLLRKEAKLIQRARQLQHAGARDQPVRRLEAVDAAERRRPDHRAVGLAAERERHHADGDGSRRAARRAAGGVLRIVRIAGLAGRVGRELGGHRLAEDDRACRAQHRHHGRVMRPACVPRAARCRPRSACPRCR